MIYKNRDGSYSYTHPKVGDEKSVNPGGPEACPEGTVPVALYHTHPAIWEKIDGGWRAKYDSENFSSSGDISYSNRFGIDAYVATPAGKLKYYNHTSKKISTIGKVETRWAH